MSAFIVAAIAMLIVMVPAGVSIVRGTDADERFLFEGILGVWIRAGAGDDEILGTPQPDRIDGGAGEDTVTAYGGRDVCTRAEHTRGCDELS